MSKLKAVVFFFFCTIFNTFELICAAYRHVANTHNLRVPTPDEIKIQLGKSLPDIFKTFYPEHNIQELLNTNNQYVAANAMKSEAFHGIEELLQFLKEKQLQLSILTSVSSKVYDILDHHNLTTYFTSVVHHEKINRPKPDPEGFLLACKECDVEPQEAIMVGDTTQDIATGKNAKAFATIAVTHGYGLAQDLIDANADYVVSDLNGVKDVIAKLLQCK